MTVEQNGVPVAWRDTINLINGGVVTDNPTNDSLDIALFNVAPPLHSTDPGVAGQMAYDSTYFYLYQGGSWKRIALLATAF